jgi:hypothetical protein
MSCEKGFAGGDVQIANGVHWGANGTVGTVGANNSKYVFQILDQNGDPIRARQAVKVHLCTCATAIPSTSATMGPLTPTAVEIVSSLALPQAAGVIVANGEAVHPVENGDTDPAGNYYLAGVIGIRGLIQAFVPTVAGAATYDQFIFETDANGMFTYHTTAAPALTAIVITLPSGKCVYFKNCDAA